MIIAISGKIGAGKTELAKDLSTQLGSARTMALADSLKWICGQLANDEGQWSSEGKERVNRLGMTNGQLQQVIGDGLRNLVHQDIWVMLLIDEIETQERSQIIIVPDMRYKSEARIFRARGAYLIRIDGSRTGPGSRNPNSKGEVDLDDWDDWDYRFDNTALDRWDLEGIAIAISQHIAARTRT